MPPWRLRSKPLRLGFPLTTCWWKHTAMPAWTPRGEMKMQGRNVTKAPGAVTRIVADRIKAARIAADMSQEALGDASGVTFQQIQKYERGTNRVSADRLHQIADALGKPISYFFDDAPLPKVPADDELLTGIIQWLEAGATPRRILAVLPS